LAPHARAQPAANARPGGAQVVAGQASIGGNSTTTLITQQSQNAVINWNSYNIGSAQTVQYAQPNARSFTLNRVISAQPSQIAGHIIANGQIAIINQSGVVFYRGATVDASGVIVSASGITNQDFMAGRLVFSQAPTPGASISNAGNITVAQAGLAALVAPQVANSGVISAQLGRVVLGGAATFALDMNGDGLVALNVTGQVTQVQIGNQTVPALVTNIGTILAPGGTVVLTARAADGLLQKIVAAGGTIAAPTVGGQTGRVLVSGIGGDVEIDGTVSATGTAAGSTGGQVEVNSDHNVTIASGAVVDTSGDAGGGVVAIGTAAAHAVGGDHVASTLNARSVTIAAGARVRADAVTHGHGGTIAVVGSVSLTQQGALSARGGALGGNGGVIALNTPGTLVLGGSADAGATKGLAGTLRAESKDVFLNGALGDGSGACNPNCSGTTAFWEVDATHNIYVNYTAATVKPNGGTTDLSGIIERGVTISGLVLDAGNAIDISGNLYVTTDAKHPTARLLPLELIAGAGGINLVAFNATPALVEASAVYVSAKGGALTEGSNGGNFNIVDPSGAPGTLAILTDSFYQTPNTATGPGPGAPTTIDLLGLANSFGTLTTYSTTNPPPAVTTTSVNIDDTVALDIAANITASGNVAVSTTNGDLTDTGNITTTAANGTILLAASGSLFVAGTLTAGQSGTAYTGAIALESQSGSIEEGIFSQLGEMPGALLAGKLAARAAGDILLSQSGNDFASVGTVGALAGVIAGTLTADDNANLYTSGPLTIANNIEAANIAIEAGGTVQENAGVTIEATGGVPVGTARAVGIIPGTLSITADTGNIVLLGTTQAGPLVGGVYDGSIALAATAGSITETMTGTAGQGTLDAGTLAARAGTSLLLGNAANTISTIGTVVAINAGEGTGTLVGLTAGTLATTDVLQLASGAALNIAGNVTGAEVALSAGAGLIVDDSYAITATGAGTVPGALTIVTADALTLEATASLSAVGGTIGLEADQFALSGTVDAGGGEVAADRFTTGALIFGSGTTVTGTTYVQNFGTLTAGTLVLGSLDGGLGNTSFLSIQAAPPTDINTLGVFSTGDISDTGMALNVASLFGQAGGNITLSNNFNQIGDIAPLGKVPGLSAAGTLELFDTAELSVGSSGGGATLSGATAAYLDLSLGLFETAASVIESAQGVLVIDATESGLTLNGGVRAGTLVLAAPNGGITATGAVQAGTLAGNGSSVDLSGGNDIGLIAPVSVADTDLNLALSFGGLSSETVLELNDTALLKVGSGATGADLAAITGIYLKLGDGLAQSASSLIADTAGPVVIDATAGNLTVGGTVNAGSGAGTLVLTDAGGTVGGDGTLQAGVLAGTASIFGLAGPNVISGIGSVSVADANLNLSISAPGLSAGETLGLKDTALLTLDSGASIGGGNGVYLKLSDGLTQLAGSTIGSPGGTVAIDAPGGDIALDGAVQGNTVVLDAAAGSIGASGGLTATTLAGTAGAIDIAGTNAIGTIGAVSVADAALGLALAPTGLAAGTLLELADGGALTIGGASTAATLGGGAGVYLALTSGLTLNARSLIQSTGGTVVIDSTGGDIALGGTVQAGVLSGGAYSGTLVLAAPGGSVSGAGVLEAGVLAGTATSFGLAGANLIGGIGPVNVADADLGLTFTVNGLAATGAIGLSDGTLLSLGSSSTISGPGGIYLVLPGGLAQSAGNVLSNPGGTIVIDATGGNIALGGTVQASTLVLDAPAGNITGGGAVDATTLAGNAGLIALTGGNDIGTIGPLSVADPALGLKLALTGLTAGGALEVQDGGALTLAAGGTISGATGVYLLLADGLTQAGGSLISSPGSVVAVDATGGNIGLGGNVQGGTVVLAAAQGDVVGAGAITAGTLAAAADAIQLSGGNAVSSIGPVSVSDADLGFTLASSGVSATAAVEFKDASLLSVSGEIGGGAVDLLLAKGLAESAAGVIAATTGPVVIDATAGNMVLGGTVQSGDFNGTVYGGTLVLAAPAGSITGAGTVLAGVLAGKAQTIDLDGTANCISAIDAVTVIDTALGLSLSPPGVSATTSLVLVDTASLSVGTAGTASALQAQSLTLSLLGGGPTPGKLTDINGLIAGTTNAVLLLADGLTQDAGAAISGGGTLLVDAAAGDLTAAGALSGGTLALLAAGGAIADTGSVTAGTFAASATQGVTLSGVANVIGAVDPLTFVNAGAAGTITLAGISGGPTIALRDSTDLLLGTSTAGATLSADDIAITLLTAAGKVTGTLTQTGGLVDAGNGNLLLQAKDVVQMDGVMSATGLAHVLDGALGQTGSTLSAAVVVVDGATTQSSSSISGTTVTLGGDLAQTGGTITAIDNVAVQGSASQLSKSLIDAGGSVAIDGGLIQVASAVTASGAVTIGQGVTQTDGSTLSAGGGAVSIGGALEQSNSLVTAAAAVGVGGDVLQTASTLTAGTGVQIGGSLGQTTSALTAGTDVTIAGSLTQTASVLLAEGNVAVSLSATQTGSNLTAVTGALDIGGELNQDVSTASAGAAGTVSGALVQDAGTLTVNTLQVDGAVTQTQASLLDSIGGGMVLNATVSESGSTISAATSLSVGGALSQAGGMIVTGSTAMIGGAVSQSGGTLASGGNFSAVGLTQAGNGVVTAGGGATIVGALTQVNSALTAHDELVVTGAVAQNAGTMTIGSAALLHGNLTQVASQMRTGSDAVVDGNLSQSQGSALAAVGGITAGGFIAQSDSTLQAMSGTVSAGGGVTQSLSLLSATGAITIADQLVQAGSTLTAGGQINLSGSGALVQSAGSTLSGRGGVFVTVGDGMTQDAASQVSSSAGLVDIVATGGDIDFSGTLNGHDGVRLVAEAGNINGDGMVVAPNLAGSAAGNFDLTGTANQIAAIVPAGGLEGLTAGGALTLIDATDLLLNGATISAGSSVGITATGAATFTEAAGSSIFAPQSVRLTIAGGFTQDSGSDIESYTPSAQGRPTDTGEITVDTPADISLSGTLAAGQILLGETTAPQRVIWKDNTIETGSSLRATATNADVNAPIVFGKENGVFVRTTSLVQTGATHIAPLPGAARQATIEISLTGRNGKIAFDPAYGTDTGLVAPLGQLLLVLGLDGQATGNINVAGLNVYYPGVAPLPTGSARLTGTINGLSGYGAAGEGFTHSTPTTNYEINNCPIQSVNCVVLSPIVVPLNNPTQDAQTNLLRSAADDDDDLLLPNVAEQDY
jgi:filamentous hemagglutinin family protein